jgi:omega-6 fatty acid desaturase (delta-12 desaturase)
VDRRAPKEDLVSEISPGAAASPTAPSPHPESRAGRPAWVTALKRFEKTNPRRVAGQLFDTLVPYLGLLALMCLTTVWHLPYVVTALLTIPAGALLIRMFIILHDCGHGSFVGSPFWRQVIGNVLGVLTFTAFSDWRRSHGTHHTTSGNLDRRGIGDVWTMTMEEYAASSPARRLWYRIFRNPLVMFGVGPFFSFVLRHRVPTRGSTRNQVISVILTDAVIGGILLAAAFTIGIKAYLLIQMPIMLVGGAGGVWLFYIQHQFEDAYWERGEGWDYTAAALKGSSFYELPRVLQWFTGNIGFHHVHHLSPRIPNYNLEACHRSDPLFREVKAVTLLSSMRSFTLRLWDESAKKLVGFKHLRELRERRRRASPQ